MILRLFRLIHFLTYLSFRLAVHEETVRISFSVILSYYSFISLFILFIYLFNYLFVVVLLERKMYILIKEIKHIIYKNANFTNDRTLNWI